MCNNSNTSKKTNEMKEGVFAAFYGEKFFVKVKQALGIGKVHFSFVEVGTKGEGLDVYVDADDFDNLCDDILNGRLQKKISESQSRYPDSWKYTTGQDASKTLAFGKGLKVPVVIQGYDAKKNKRINVGVMSFDELRTMAKWWRRISANYFDGLVEVCLKASYSRPTDSAADEKTQPVPTDEPVNPPKQQPTPQQPKTVTMTVTAKAKCNERSSKKGDYAMACCEGTDVKTGKTANVVIPAAAVKKMTEDSWKKFLERSNDRNTPLSFKGVFEETEENGRPVYVFQGFVK